MKPIVITLLTIFSLQASAASGVNCIWIKHTNNSTSCFMLEAKPKIVFDDESVIIESQHYHIDDIVSYRFGQSDETSVENISSDGLYFVFNNDVIEIKGFENDGTDVTIQLFDSKGAIIQNSIRTVKSKHLLFDIKELGAGVYVLNVDESTFKFSKR